MSKFKVLCPKFWHRDGKKMIRYERGEVLESSRPLNLKFPGSFKLLDKKELTKTITTKTSFVAKTEGAGDVAVTEESEETTTAPETSPAKSDIIPDKETETKTTPKKKVAKKTPATKKKGTTTRRTSRPKISRGNK